MVVLLFGAGFFNSSKSKSYSPTLSRSGQSLSSLALVTMAVWKLELEDIRRLDHPNVMKLEGMITSRVSGSLYLIFEYMEHDLAGLAAILSIKITEAQVPDCIAEITVGGEVGCMISEGPWVFVGIPNFVKAWNTQTTMELSLNGHVGQVYALVMNNDILFAGCCYLLWDA